MSKAIAPIVCYVTDRKQLRQSSLHEAIRGALEAGANWVQIREKDLPTRELLSFVVDALTLARISFPEARVHVNDRLDVAIAADAHGVHLGGESMPAAEVVGWPKDSPSQETFSVGVSCHAAEEVIRAERDGASYAILGPIFETPSKAQFGPPVGLGVLAEACRAVKIPVLAIGGMVCRLGK